MIGKSRGPSAGEMAGAQSAANQQAMLQSLLGSQVNQVTPFGRLTWSGSIPIVDPQTGQVSSYVNMPGAGSFQGGQTGGQAPSSGGGINQPEISGGSGQFGPGGEVFFDENYPPGQVPGQGGQGMSGQSMSGQGPFSPRTMTVELSPHGQYMQQGQENIAKALLDRASRTATQVQGQQEFNIGGLGLPPQVSRLGTTGMLSQFTPVGAAGMAPGVSNLARALMRGK